jgi:antitoxin component of MazEF toxin-antitoxin module
MGITKSASSNIRKLTKQGKASIAVTLPLDFVRKLKWKEKQKVVVVLKGKTLTVKDWEQKSKKK